LARMRQDFAHVPAISHPQNPPSCGRGQSRRADRPPRPHPPVPELTPGGY
jgi:hypothetical protein